MNIHLGGGVRGVGEDLPYFQAIIETINSRGDVILTNWVRASSSIHKTVPDHEMDWDNVVFRNVESMHAADVYIAEITTYRLYHGFEMSTMLQQGKPVLLLSRKSLREFAISGLHHELLEMYEYGSEEQLKRIVDQFLEKYKNMAMRISVPIDPKTAFYLEKQETRTGKRKEQIVKELISKGIALESLE